MIPGKPEGWIETLDDLIRANFNYEDTNLALKKKFGDKGTLGGPDYRSRKSELLGGEKVDEKIDELGGRKRIKKEKPPPSWSKQKQTVADGSTLAKVINVGVYQGMLPFCENHELKEEHVQEINPGGAIVANITYFFPESKLEHPLVMLGIRVVILYIKFKSVCSKVHEKVNLKGEYPPITKPGQGLKPGMKTDMRK